MTRPRVLWVAALTLFAVACESRVLRTGATSEKAGCFFRLSAGWHNLEGNGSDWWRWTDKTGKVTVTAAQRSEVVLAGELFSWRQPNTVDVVLNGTTAATVNVTWDRFGPFKPIPLSLKAGTNTIAFVSHKPAVTTAQDPRPLAVAVKNLSLTMDTKDACVLEP